MWGMKSTLREFHEKYSEFEIFLVAASWCSGKARRRSAEEAQKHHQRRIKDEDQYKKENNKGFFDDKRPAYFND